ncbi:MAG: DUF4116 domain-containing protein [Candidatus Saganbacteria bacterium]|nr:DUF4116 domain-containing protein [Candidatus Saganbacteria bacterium]
MSKITLTDLWNIEDIYSRLRKIDAVRDGKADGIITREELAESAKTGIDTTVKFNEGIISSYDVIQKLYLKLQTIDKEDGTNDGLLNTLRVRQGVALTPQQQDKVSIELDLDDSDISAKKELAIAKVRDKWYALEEMDASLKKDKEVVLAAVRSDGKALGYADDSLKKDRGFVLEAVKTDGCALNCADALFKRDKEIVLSAVKSSWTALKYADDSLKKDKYFMIEAVKQNGCAIEYADITLKKDKDVVLAAVKQEGYALQFADDSLKGDKDLILQAVGQYNNAIKYAGPSLLKDKDFMMAAVKQYGLALELADDHLKKDKEIVLAAVMQNGHALSFADDAFKKDKVVVLAAVRQDRFAIKHSDVSLQKDRDVLLANKPGLKNIFNLNMNEEKYIVSFVSNMTFLEYQEETDDSLQRSALSGNILLSSYRTITGQIEITGLKGLGNIDPESAKELTSIMAEIDGSHGLWATQSKHAVRRDVRLTEMFKNSVILRLLVSESKMKIPVKTQFDFVWSHADSIPVNLPSNVYWYKKDIPELRGLLNNKYEVYKNAAAKALEKIEKEGTEDQGLEAGKKPSPEKAQALRKMMEDKDWTLRYRALEALRISGANTSGFTPEIYKLFNDKEWYVHNSAGLIIGKEKGKHIEYLKDSLKTGSVFAQNRATDILNPSNPK